MFDGIDALPPGSPVLFNFDFEAGTKGELAPMATALPPWVAFPALNPTATALAPWLDNPARSPTATAWTPGSLTVKIFLCQSAPSLVNMVPRQRNCESSDDIAIVPMDSFELERLIGDVCRSINQMAGGATQNQLLDLCDRLEAAEKYGDGMLDVL